MSLSRRDFLKASASVGSAAMLANRLRMVSRGMITPFTPDQVTGIYAWYRADLGTYQTVSGSAATADGDPVGEWQDQSGSALHVTQGTAGNRPTLQLSELYGRPVLRFDGTNDYLQAAAAALRTNDRDDVIHLIRTAVDQHDPNVVWIHLLPMFDSLRNDSRFLEIASQIGLTADEKSSVE